MASRYPTMTLLNIQSMQVLKSDGANTHPTPIFTGKKLGTRLLNRGYTVQKIDCHWRRGENLLGGCGELIERRINNLKYLKLLSFLCPNHEYWIGQMSDVLWCPCLIFWVSEGLVVSEKAWQYHQHSQGKKFGVEGVDIFVPDATSMFLRQE